MSIFLIIKQDSLTMIQVQILKLNWFLGLITPGFNKPTSLACTKICCFQSCHRFWICADLHSLQRKVHNYTMIRIWFQADIKWKLHQIYKYFSNSEFFSPITDIWIWPISFWLQKYILKKYLKNFDLLFQFKWLECDSKVNFAYYSQTCHSQFFLVSLPPIFPKFLGLVRFDCSPVPRVVGRWDCLPNLAMSHASHVGARHMSRAYHMGMTWGPCDVSHGGHVGVMWCGGHVVWGSYVGHVTLSHGPHVRPMW